MKMGFSVFVSIWKKKKVVKEQWKPNHTCWLSLGLDLQVTSSRDFLILWGFEAIDIDLSGPKRRDRDAGIGEGEWKVWEKWREGVLAWIAMMLVT